MMFPTVHLNGTSRGALTEVYSDALSALATAIRAIEDAAPNARDYYPQGPDAFARAAAEHAERLAKLANVRREINDILWNLADSV